MHRSPKEPFGVVELDLSMVVGADRRVTRLISQWAFEAKRDDEFLYGGIWYVSRLDAEYECWAIFQGSPIAEFERQPVLRTNADLCRVAAPYGLTAH